MAAESIREKIIQAIIAKLARVRLSSQWATDCGANVHRDKKQLDAESDVPAFIVFAGEEAATRGNGYVTCLMDVTIDGHVLLESTNPSVMKERILADVVKIMTDRQSMKDTTDGLADDVVYQGGGNPAMAQSNDVSVGVSTVFSVKYRYKTGDPYNQE